MKKCCVDCKHRDNLSFDCQHPNNFNMEIDPVFGEVQRLKFPIDRRCCSWQREHYGPLSRFFGRIFNIQKCGQEGRWFEKNT